MSSSSDSSSSNSLKSGAPTCPWDEALLLIHSVGSATLSNPAMVLHFTVPERFVYLVEGPLSYELKRWLWLSLPDAVGDNLELCEEASQPLARLKRQLGHFCE